MATTKKPRPAKSPSEQEKQQIEAENPPAEANGAPMSKADAVRAALAEGIEKPQEGIDFIKTRFGIEMEKTVWSATKAQIKNREGKGRPKQTHQLTAIPTGFADDVRSVKSLIESAGGAEQAEAMIDAMGGLIAKYGADGLRQLVQAFG